MQNQKLISCITIEDDPLMSAILEELIEEELGIELLGQYQDGVEGIKAIHHLKPEFIFLDINMPGIDGLEVFELSDHKPFVIIISGEQQLRKECENIPQVIAFLDKPVDKKEFKKAVDIAIKFSEMERNIG